MGILRIRCKEATLEEVHHRIVSYCELLGNSYWGQEPYKQDFFGIFYLAWYNGFFDERKYKSDGKKSKGIQRREFIIDGTLLRELLLEKWLKGKHGTKRQREMIDELVEWWDEWSYAWSYHPVGVPRKYIRRRKS